MKDGLVVPEDFEKEALELIAAFGGYVPEDRDWKEKCTLQFMKMCLEPIHWDTVYYQALNIESRNVRACYEKLKW